MGKLLGKKKVVLFDIDYTLFDTDLFKESQLKKHSVYEEVHTALNKLLSVADLGIFSEGKVRLQTKKLKKTDIIDYFNKDFTHIVEAKEKELKKILQKYKNAKLFFVDDKLTILYKAKMIDSSLSTIWVKRGPYAQKQRKIKNFVPDAIVGNLEEVVSLIANY
ncbi:MAG: hypothetical protein HYY87_00120 [Candidatus Levybacteria bacterium]|nr:hypothetical protein [Candidatus Levybacteria bacterium]MBI2622690.1 hypothetical protein [Candidatus Levybacteria bacterium]MBI3069695.1 hypothetical protein [Candidatus Levybacteria bacterium]MBI3092820.1 hypothetical protein [Candidatus Levybacteria bacterium]